MTQDDLLKTAFLVVLFVFAEVAPWVVVYVACLPIFILLVATSPRNAANLLAICWPLILISLLGGIVSMVSGSMGVDAAKGAYYTSRPLVFIGAGIYLQLRMRLPFHLLRRAIVIAAVILSFMYAYKYASTGGAEGESRYALRDAIGVGYITVAIAAALVVGHVTSLRIKPIELVALPVIAGAMYLSGSRSGLITMAVLVFSYYAPLILVPFAAVSLAAILFVLTTPFIQLIFDPDLLRQMFYKLPSGVVEIISIQRYSDAEVNVGWRGFETFRAFSHVWDEGALATLFGTGWHALVPILWRIKLGADYLTDIPVFHNAWSFIFVRSGCAGLALIFVQFWLWVSLFRRKLRSGLDPSASEVRNFAAGLVLVSLVNIPMIASIYNPGAPGQVLSILIGFCTAHYLARPDSIRATEPTHIPGRSSPDVAFR
ncbi:hypothetical protein NLM33_17680 [Bradyrhizobium sp. CCGUVB1N3]|uniref:hypothetical protein n=1 Tax=Bradyrhizobium sp. CCGUVB1N3 TaxID=2949629 RepID=UPI0020B250E0|nr:hypothetical protein [Bradyrhizobium sp. CCGUVB1N3]MCP3472147.1 hypothetical protein [Bradyrhizobium sp. CCGUVB1N3]